MTDIRDQAEPAETVGRAKPTPHPGFGRWYTTAEIFAPLPPIQKVCTGCGGDHPAEAHTDLLTAIVTTDRRLADREAKQARLWLRVVRKLAGEQASASIAQELTLIDELVVTRDFVQARRRLRVVRKLAT